MTTRRPRDERRPGVRVVLGPRDEVLLRGLARFRAASTGQLTRLYFQGTRRDTAAVRLRRLYDARLLDVVLSALNAENVYAVGPVGRVWLEARGVACPACPRGSLDHHLAVVNAWTKLAAALHGRTDVVLKCFVPDWELRSSQADSRLVLVPDAAIELTRQAGSETDRQIRAFLEVDLGTERQGVLDRKIATYGSEPAMDGAWLAVVLVNAGSRRVQAVGRLLERFWPARSLTCLESEWPNAVLARVTQQRAHPLAASHSGKGSLAAATQDAAASSQSQGEPPSP